MWKHSGRYFMMTILAVMGVLGVTFSCWAKEVKIGTGATAAENIFSKIAYPLERAHGVTMAVTISGPVQAWKDLDAGKIDAAAGGVDLNDWIAMMEKEGYTISDKSAYKSWVIGKDKVAVLTNPDVTVESLNKAQLAAIFTGKAKNWSELGGPDKPIIVILGSVSGTQTVFQKQIMDGAEYTKKAMQGTIAADLKDRVIRNSGAVCVAAMSLVDHLVNAPAIPEVGRPITLITKGNPSEAFQMMLKYINGDGQKYITK